MYSFTLCSLSPDGLRSTWRKNAPRHGSSVLQTEVNVNATICQIKSLSSTSKQVWPTRCCKVCSCAACVLFYGWALPHPLVGTEGALRTPLGRSKSTDPPRMRTLAKSGANLYVYFRLNTSRNISSFRSAIDLIHWRGNWCWRFQFIIRSLQMASSHHTTWVTEQRYLKWRLNNITAPNITCEVPICPYPYCYWNVLYIRTYPPCIANSILYGVWDILMLLKKNWNKNWIFPSGNSLVPIAPGPSHQALQWRGLPWGRGGSRTREQRRSRWDPPAPPVGRDWCTKLQNGCAYIF